MNAVKSIREPRAEYLALAEPALPRGFELLATAKGGVARLRELILSLAVQGKLARHEKSDEPAAVLLGNIAAKKRELATSGKIKKSKCAAVRLSEGLPSNWSLVTLDDICVVITDGDHLPPPRAETGVPFLVIGDVRSGYIDLSRAERFVSSGYFDNLDWSRRPIAGDVLYTTVGSFGIPIPVVRDQEFCFQRHIALLRPGVKALQPYLLLALRSPAVFAQASSGATGIAQKTVGLAVLRAISIALPPLAEQHRIVARVEELMALCDELEARGRLADEQHARLTATLFDALTASDCAQTLADNWQRIAAHFDLLLDRPQAIDALEQTILQLAVRGLLVPQDSADEPASASLACIRVEKDRLIAEGHVKRDKPIAPVPDEMTPFDVRSGWEWAPFGELVNISSGITLGRKTTPSKPVTLPYLRVANVQRWHLDLDDLKIITVREDELPRFLLQRGDLLLTEGGDWDKVGRTCIWQGAVAQCLHQNHVFKARGVWSEWSPAWAELYLNSAYARTYFARASKQTTNLASINSTQLKSCPFPVPPVAEQHRIVARVEQLRRLCADLRECLQQSRSTQSRLADALASAAVQPPAC